MLSLRWGCRLLLFCYCASVTVPLQMIHSDRFLCPIIFVHIYATAYNMSIDFANAFEMDISIFFSIGFFHVNAFLSSLPASSSSLLLSSSFDPKLFFVVCVHFNVTHYLDWCIRNGSLWHIFASFRRIGIDIWSKHFVSRLIEICLFKRTSCKEREPLLWAHTNNCSQVLFPI